MLFDIQVHTISCNDNPIIIATAYFKTNPHSKLPPLTQKQTLKHAQKQSVRTLLKNIIDNFNFAHNYELNESSFPYFLIDKHNHNPPLFVSFSHSQNQVALVLYAKKCAIDIELNPIKETIAKRYFHPLEYQYIHQFDDNKKTIVINKLWQLKECLIKYHNKKLFNGISDNCADIITQLSANTHFKWGEYGVICQDDWTAIYQLS